MAAKQADADGRTRQVRADGGSEYPEPDGPNAGDRAQVRGALETAVQPGEPFGGAQDGDGHV